MIYFGHYHCCVGEDFSIAYMLSPEFGTRLCKVHQIVLLQKMGTGQCALERCKMCTFRVC